MRGRGTIEERWQSHLGGKRGKDKPLTRRGRKPETWGKEKTGEKVSGETRKKRARESA